jgi:hypothetical protein
VARCPAPAQLAPTYEESRQHACSGWQRRGGDGGTTDVASILWSQFTGGQVWCLRLTAEYEQGRPVSEGFALAAKWRRDDDDVRRGGKERVEDPLLGFDTDSTANHVTSARPRERFPFLGCRTRFSNARRA